MLIRCPICKTETTWEENPHRPFCSERCKLIDLGKWASDGYTIPGEPLKHDDDEEAAEDATGRDA